MRSLPRAGKIVASERDICTTRSRAGPGMPVGREGTRCHCGDIVRLNVRMRSLWIEFGTISLILIVSILRVGTLTVYVWGNDNGFNAVTAAPRDSDKSPLLKIVKSKAHSLDVDNISFSLLSFYAFNRYTNSR